MENLERKQATTKHSSHTFLIIAIIMIGFNLRPAITSVGPLLGTIRDQIGLANWSAGTITSLPLIAFAVMSPLAPKVGKRLGNEKAILIGLLLLFIGMGIRSIPFTVTLFIGTAIIGIGIAVINVLLPAVIKEKFPHKVGKMTSAYSTAMVVFAATASGLSVPIAKTAGLGWELSLFSWGGFAIVAIVLWSVVTRRTRNETVATTEVKAAPALQGTLWKSLLAWQVTLFMGFQSFAFYVMVSWLPEILQSLGFSIVVAGWLVSLAQFIGLPATFLAPILAEKFANQQGVIAVIGGLYTIGFSGILIGGPVPLIIFFVILIGIASGGSISLSLALLGLRAQDAEQAGELSGMAQSVGYVLAALGPFVIGLLYDMTHAWTVPLVTIVVICILMIIVGIGAGRNKYVMEMD